MEDSFTKRDDIYSKRVRAGKRTYFFDVKVTKASDYYLTITESKRRMNDEGEYSYEKHKIFLYKEDFHKFVRALDDTVGHIKENLLPDVDFSQYEKEDDYKNY